MEILLSISALPTSRLRMSSWEIQWRCCSRSNGMNPFGLVMVEAMACGTPVLAMPGGSVQEVVRGGVSGYTCRSVREMVKRTKNLNFDPVAIRSYVEENFSIERMVRGYVALYKEAVAKSKIPEAA